MSGTATRKAVDVTFYALTSAVDMAECLDDLLDIGYTGTVTASRDVPGNPNWVLTISSARQPLATARIGDVLIWDGVILAAITAEAFAADYEYEEAGS